MKWTKSGFEDFRKGTFGNGGHNIYVSAKGVLQRIRNFDINGDGYFDLPLANSHSMCERPNLHIYDDVYQEKPLELPSNGSFDAIFTDLTGDGCDDLVVACQHNGVHTDVSAVIYFGSELGLSEKYSCELRVPNSLSVAAGDFNGTGKKSLAFSSEKDIRIFYNGDIGIEPSIFETLNIEAISLAAGDLDGDGYDDLFVMHGDSARLAVYWGGEDGINPDRKTEFGTTVDMTKFCAASTTPGRKLARWILWHCRILDYKGKKVTFRVEKDNTVVFESFGKDRQPKEELRLEAFSPEKISHYRNPYSWNGVMDVCMGDLRNDGSRDIVIASKTSRDENTTDDLVILWEDKDYSPDAATIIPVRAPKTVFIGSVGKDEKNYLFVNQASTPIDLDIEIPIFSFEKDKSYKIVRHLPVREPGYILTGKTRTDGGYQLAVINHEGETKMGFEQTAIYYGSPDGFDPERKINFPGCASVDMITADFTDNGYADVLITNCAENAPELDPGSEIYLNGPEGFDLNNKISLNTYSAHGTVIGDFRHSGYLDIIWTAINERIIHIIEGGPDGYNVKNQKEIILGDVPELAPKNVLTVQDEWFPPKEGERARIYEFGGMRNPICVDLNGDGWLDLVLPQLLGHHTMIMWGGPDGFSKDNMQILATDGVVTANAADLDGDGYIDLVLGGFTGTEKSQVKESYTTIYWGGPEGFTENRKAQLQAFCTNDLTINDFNGDGVLDIFSASYYGIRTRDAHSYLHYGSKDGVFYHKDLKLIPSNSGSGAISGDFNGDGYIDLAVASHKAHGNHVCDSFVYWGGPDGLDFDNPTRIPGRGPHGITTYDPGNIMDRSDSEYYYSEGYMVPEGKRAVKASWEATNGKRTWVKIQLRCADTIDALEAADWSESFDNGADISALNLKGYIQYKLELGAPCGAGTPRVTEVTIDFE